MDLRKSGLMPRGYQQMMKVRILWVGRTKENYLIEGINYYLKLLKNTINLKIMEIKGEKGKDRPKTLSEEGKRILRQTSSYVLLDEKGVEMSTKQFASFLSRRDSVDFVIGGHFGVSDEVRKNSSLVLAISKMTLTHEMTRLILLEQLYRSVTIIKGMEYHY